jgi:elongation factor Ts
VTRRSPRPRDARRGDQSAVPVGWRRARRSRSRKEREIFVEQVEEDPKAGQAREIVAKMVEGKIRKFLGEITLLGQPFVKDDKQTVEKLLAGRPAPGSCAIVRLRGGRRHREEAGDFAAEVMAQVRGA